LTQWARQEAFAPGRCSMPSVIPADVLSQWLHHSAGNDGLLKRGAGAWARHPWRHPFMDSDAIRVGGHGVHIPPEPPAQEAAGDLLAW